MEADDLARPGSRITHSPEEGISSAGRSFGAKAGNNRTRTAGRQVIRNRLRSFIVKKK